MDKGDSSPISEVLVATKGFKNGLRRTPKGFYEYKIRVGRITKSGTFSTTRLETAKQLLEQLRDDLLREQEGLEVRMTVAEVMDYWSRTRGAQPLHLQRARYAFDKIRPILGDLPVKRLTPAAIVAMKKALMDPLEPGQRALSPSSVNIVLRYLGVAISWAYRNRRLAAHPLREMPYEALKEDNRPFLVLEDVVPFLQQVDELGNLDQRVAVRTMLLMGLRESEALRLRWDGFSSDGLYYGPARSKNGKAQRIPVAGEVRRILAAFPKECEWVLPGRAGSLHMKGYTRSVVKKAGEAIGKPGLTPHRLRASCATIAAAGGGGAHQVREALRHESISTSQIYVQKVPAAIKVLMDRVFEGVEEAFTPPASSSMPVGPS